MNKESLIIIAILLVIFIFAVKGSIAHLKGEGACCGGEKQKVVKKKMKGKPQCQFVVRIEGMHCDNCSNRIERSLNELDGVVAKVKRSRKQAVVDLFQQVDEETICNQIEMLGFEVKGVEKR